MTTTEFFISILGQHTIEQCVQCADANELMNSKTPTTTARDRMNETNSKKNYVFITRENKGC